MDVAAMDVGRSNEARLSDVYSDTALFPEYDPVPLAGLVGTPSVHLVGYAETTGKLSSGETLPLADVPLAALTEVRTPCATPLPTTCSHVCRGPPSLSAMGPRPCPCPSRQGWMAGMAGREGDGCGHGDGGDGGDGNDGDGGDD